MGVALRRRMPNRQITALIAASLCGCMDFASDDPPDRESSFESAIVEGSVDAFRALRVANSASAAVLRTGVGLTTPTAQNIVARRNGADGVGGTADDRPYYTLAEVDAVSGVGPASLDRLAAYGRAHPEILGGGLRTDALPPELAAEAPMIDGIASDASLAIDGDPTTLLPPEWELGALFAHHFFPSTAVRVAKLRQYEFGSDVRRGPFLDIVTLDRARFGEGQPSFALLTLLRRTAADPQHTVGRVYAPELAAALADPTFVAQNPGVAILQRDFLSIWNAQIQVTDPGDLPLPLARTRALLQSRGVETFNAPYPTEQPTPPVLAAPFPMPFQSGTEIICMQGNNSMAAHSSHGPDQLRYAIDLNAPLFTTLVASAAGTAYVYDNARPNSFDNFGFGNILLIDLHNGFALLYAHVDTFDVINGQNVTAGQSVGTVGITGAAGDVPHVHFQVVPLFRTPDPANEEYHSDTPIPADAPFGGPVPFSLSAIDVTAGDTTAKVTPSAAFACGESGWLYGAAHIYRAP